MPRTSNVATPDHRFARLRPKVDLARDELDWLNRSFGAMGGSDGEWGRVLAVASTLSKVYDVMEDVMSDIARDVDVGDDSRNASLIERMSAPMEGRPPLLGSDIRPAIVRLKNFRDLVRKPVRDRPRAGETLANLPLMNETFSAFVSSVEALASYVKNSPTAP